MKTNYRPAIGTVYIVLLSLFPVADAFAGCPDTTGMEQTITIDAGKDQGTVSPLMMGFNTVYCYEPDRIWQGPDARIPRMLAALQTGILRYPGGTVVTRYHWENPGGQGWADSWDPQYNGSKDLPPSDFMNMDEYLDACIKLKTEPLIGINMGSGKKYNRVQEGVEQAKRLMLHCKSRGVKVTYYYLDNEPYQPDANYTYTADEYADMVNTYAAEMRKIDSRIKLIVNTHPRNLAYTSTLISKAGKNFDYIDIHYYWRWGNATYANWKSEIPMRQGGGLPYIQQRPFFRKLADSLGYPHIDLVSLEWNIGRIGNGHVQPTESEIALMVSEQFTQFIQSGMPIATFWPLSWPRPSDFESRIVFNAREDYRPNKVYYMFGMYKDILGGKMIENKGATDALRVLTVKNVKQDTLWVYLINKHPGEASAAVKLQLQNFTARHYHAAGFQASDDNKAWQLENVKIETADRGSYRLNLPGYSLTKIVFTRQ